MTPIDVAKYVGVAVLIFALIGITAMYLQYRKMEGNPGPWKFNPAEFPIVLTGVQLSTITKGAYTLSSYLYIEGSKEQRVNPQTLWRWGINDPIRNAYAKMMASYIPAEEKIRLDFRTAPTGDEHASASETNLKKIVSIDVTNINPHKWFHIAIAVEGRSIDIYVNGQHSNSLQLPNVLKHTTDGIQIVGNSGILGKMALWNITEGRLSDKEVLAQYKSTSDLSGPLIPIDYSFVWKFPNLNFCPGMPWCEEIKGDCKTYVNYEYA